SVLVLFDYQSDCHCSKTTFLRGLITALLCALRYLIAAQAGDMRPLPPSLAMVEVSEMCRFGLWHKKAPPKRG
ncbi:hypothetical protein, partial [Dubosiella newyorkensis]|uniref:hypothetical protein n=1 Tax=Dubosiella newyorkensis TaxID=1862672 RepID=UPI00259C82D9